MSLTMPGRPLSSHPPDTVNYRIEAPAHRLLLDPFPRRVRAELAGRTVLDSVRGSLLHESNLLPQLYVPRADVAPDLLVPTEHTTHCPFKGDAAYWSVVVGDRTAENAVWAYPEPLAAAAWLHGLVAFYWASMDAWHDEDTHVEGHLRDPYHRVDVRPSSRRVEVLAHDEVIAETSRAVVLSETGLPNRWYLPREDVAPDVLTPSGTRTVCPYKGTASYHGARTGDGLIEDAAFSYPEPLDGVSAIAGRVCFLGDGVRTRVDGRFLG
ncbi:MAG: DUF427 domain-containing protein [Actinomycetota bacterium]|nr:DUF427 domain-containing protein [Actinomycetota bacterium]